MVSSWRKALIATNLYNAANVTIDGPLMNVSMPPATCRIELLANSRVSFRYTEGDEKIEFVETEKWSTPVLGYLSDFYEKQQQDFMRHLAAEEPRCYRCAQEGHLREMQLVPFRMFRTTEWDKPWSPTQGCFQCANCGKLTCWTHSDNRKPCDCGATHWIEKMYLQKELDSG